MDEMSALFARISMSEAAFDRWLSSDIRSISDYSDWGELIDAGDAPSSIPMTVDDYLDVLSSLSEDFCCEYDEGAFFAADTARSMSPVDIAVCFAALRGAADHKDDDAPSYIYAFDPATGDPGPLLEIKRGTSSFISPDAGSEDVLCFINDAEEFVEALSDQESE